MTFEDQIRELLPRVRPYIKGSMDPMIDSILDAEAWLRGYPTIVGDDLPREELGRVIVDDLQHWLDARARPQP